MNKKSFLYFINKIKRQSFYLESEILNKTACELQYILDLNNEES